VRHKSSSDMLYMDGFHANSKSQLEDGLLMSMTCGNDKTRLNYRGPSRQTTPWLAVLNTLRPPTSVLNHRAATYDMLHLGSDPSPVDDTEPGVLRFHVLLGFSSQFIEICILMYSILYFIKNNSFTDHIHFSLLMTFLVGQCFFKVCTYHS